MDSSWNDNDIVIVSGGGIYVWHDDVSPTQIGFPFPPSVPIELTDADRDFLRVQGITPE